MSVTPADVEATIASEHYFTADDGVAEVCRHTPIDGLVHQALGMLTFCVLVLRNGHTVTGESYCQDPAKFNAQIGKDEARKAAIDKLWPMVVYASRAEAKPAPAAPKTYTWDDIYSLITSADDKDKTQHITASMKDGMVVEVSIALTNNPVAHQTILDEINRKAATA